MGYLRYKCTNKFGFKVNSILGKSFVDISETMTDGNINKLCAKFVINQQPVFSSLVLA